LAISTNKVLFFCTGNTCRSPLAEVLARSATAGLEFNIDFISAGLHACGGQPASSGSITIATEAGTTLSRHFSQQVCPELLTNVVWTIGMTRSHVALFKARYADLFSGKIGLLGQPGIDQSEIRHSTEAEEVIDPYAGSLMTYRMVGEQIKRLTEAWLPYFQTSNKLDGGSM